MAAIVGSLALPAAATAGQYGDVQVVNSGPPADPSVFQLTSNGAGVGYAGIYFDFTASPIALSSITQLSTDYQMTVGPFGGGAPRFSLVDGSGNEAYVYFGAPTGGGSFTDANSGAWGNTGNYADLSSLDARVQSNGFGGYNSGFPPITWADLISHVGATSVSYVTIDLDAGTFVNTPSGQQMLADNFTVNSNVLSVGGGVPEPAAWALMILGFAGAGAALRRRRVALAA